MSKFMITAAAVMVTVSAATTVPALPAQAASPTTQHQVAAERAALSDRDVIELFTGQGRIIRRTPGAWKVRTKRRAEADSCADLRRDPRSTRTPTQSSTTKITVPLQSGDPYRVLDALHAFETATARIATSESATITGDGKCLVVTRGRRTGLGGGFSVGSAMGAKVRQTMIPVLLFASELTRALR